MKKLVLLLVCMFTMHTMVMADNDKPIQVNQLPAKAQTFLNTYFKDQQNYSIKATMWSSLMEKK